MPLAGVRQRKASNSGCTYLRYKNRVRRGKESGFGKASGTTGASKEASDVVGRGVDVVGRGVNAASVPGRLAQ
jgi:hypothetical protein